MTRTHRTLLVTAAITGLLTGVAVKTYAQDSTNAPGTNAPSGDNGKNTCAGKNSCKGHGGCKSSATAAKATQIKKLSFQLFQ
jgi:hypothetical protein